MPWKKEREVGGESVEGEEGYRRKGLSWRFRRRAPASSRQRADASSRAQARTQTCFSFSAKGGSLLSVRLKSHYLAHTLDLRRRESLPRSAKGLGENTSDIPSEDMRVG